MSDRPAVMVAAAAAELEAACRNEIVVPASCGIPAVRLHAPLMEEMGPVAKAWLEGSSKAETFQRALDAAAVGCLVACVRSGSDDELDWRISRADAERMFVRQAQEPTERAAWRQALKLAGIVDVDELERKIAEEAKRPRRRRKTAKSAEETEAPRDVSPTK